MDRSNGAAVSDRRAAYPEIGSAYAAVFQTVARSPVDCNNRLLVRWRHAGRGAPFKRLIGKGMIVGSCSFHKGTNILSGIVISIVSGPPTLTLLTYVE